tara:strand:+ start:423 stop:710 length:288 start_codon:yes stop_codon:yes gene_type:complete
MLREGIFLGLFFARRGDGEAGKCSGTISEKLQKNVFFILFFVLVFFLSFLVSTLFLINSFCREEYRGFLSPDLKESLLPYSLKLPKWKYRWDRPL